ncbi:unnamed protein product [Sphagnum jensenii]|uniref:Uncharacterized protein n=1 Tax=Sphagnum jensenii TaxID=128206 RepID=A0ABP0W4K2_9BRYO
MLQWPLDAAVLQPDKWLKFNLVKKQQMSHNVVKLHFALPTPQSVLDWSSHCMVYRSHLNRQSLTAGIIFLFYLPRGFDTDGMEVVRPYTPTTLVSDIGFFELVITVRSQPCSMGSSSRRVNTSLLGTPTYGQMGRFRYKSNQVWAFGMLAGGTGITPMYQEDLDRFARDYPGQFKVYYLLNQPPTEWGSGVGYVSKGMIEANCPPPTDDVQHSQKLHLRDVARQKNLLELSKIVIVCPQILRCGHPPMNKAMAAHCNDLGYTKAMQFQF